MVAPFTIGPPRTTLVQNPATTHNTGRVCVHDILRCKIIFYTSVTTKKDFKSYHPYESSIKFTGGKKRTMESQPSIGFKLNVIPPTVKKSKF